jgi:hypothetical protein
MNVSFRKLLRRSLFFTVGVLGLCAASGAQEYVIDDVAEDIQIEVLPVEAEEVSVDQPELAAPDDIVEPVDEVTPIDVVDPVIEEPEVGIPVDPAIEEPEIYIYPAIEEPEVEIVEDLPKEAIDPLADIPIEWMLRDADQVMMYSMSGAGGIDDTADEVAARAAEKAVSRSLDQIDIAPSDGPRPN